VHAKLNPRQNQNLEFNPKISFRLNSTCKKFNQTIFNLERNILEYNLACAKLYGKTQPKPNLLTKTSLSRPDPAKLKRQRNSTLTKVPI